jgi:hypothetical protein
MIENGLDFLFRRRRLAHELLESKPIGFHLSDQLLPLGSISLVDGQQPVHRPLIHSQGWTQLAPLDLQQPFMKAGVVGAEFPAHLPPGPGRAHQD